MKKRVQYLILKKSVFCLFLMVILTGCSSVITKKVQTSSREIPFEKLQENPLQYKGDTVILSGVVLDSKNTQNGTRLKVLQTPSDTKGRPENMDNSQGRFLALYKGYLDVVIYRPGREVTIGGEILGKRDLSLGGIKYTYPFIRVQDIHLWPIEKEKKRPLLYQFHYGWEGPCWGYYWSPYPGIDN